MEIFKKTYYFLPVQLLVLHFKKNQILLLFWAVLFAIVTNNFGSRFGLAYLFLDPEYMGNVGFLSFFIIGLFLGLFSVSFHITSYILDGYKFPFLAGIKKPFITYTVNNTLIPAIFMLVYIICILNVNELGIFNWRSIELAGGLLVGFLTLIFVSFVYFTNTNRDIFHLSQKIDKSLKKNNLVRKKAIQKVTYFREKPDTAKYFISFPFSLKSVEDTEFQKQDYIVRVFDQNHLNALFYQLVITILIFSINFFDGFETTTFLDIPAGASVLTFFSFILMLTGAFSYWIKRWAVTVFIGLMFVLNYIITTDNSLDPTAVAVGLSYHKNVDYNTQTIRKSSLSADFHNDKHQMIEVLEKWKKKTGEAKPKLVLICASGGGLRATLFTYNTLCYINKETDHKIFQNTHLISGASGGLIGAALYRQIYLERLGSLGEKTPTHEDYVDKISSDLLNAIAVKLFINDQLPFSPKYTKDGQKINIDRGLVFDVKLNKNVDGLLDKPLGYYKEYESEALIPLMFITPTVLNDGRQLIISPLPVSFMANSSLSDSKNMAEEIRGIEFSKLFAENNPENLNFTTALRMNASFPYISPFIALPSNPPITLGDAGMSDNYGITTASRFLYVFKDWIEENTSGVVLISIRDHAKETPLKSHEKVNLVQKILTPIGSIYKNWGEFQDYTQDNILEYTNNILKGKLDVIYFEYIVPEHKENERASLSWHLTEKEKEGIKSAIENSKNKAALTKLKNLLQ